MAYPNDVDNTSIQRVVLTNPATGGYNTSGNAGVGITGSATAAAGSAVATLTSAAGKTAYITSFQVTGGGATAASIIAVTVAGTITGSLNYRIPVPAGATLGISPLVVVFPNGIQASAANTNITVTAASFGTGNTDAAVSATGFLV